MLSFCFIGSPPGMVWGPQRKNQRPESILSGLPSPACRCLIPHSFPRPLIRSQQSGKNTRKQTTLFPAHTSLVLPRPPPPPSHTSSFVHQLAQQTFMKGLLSARRGAEDQLLGWQRESQQSHSHTNDRLSNYQPHKCSGGKEHG